MAREINLVPDIKFEAIKAIKIRNLTFFICILVSAGAIGLIMLSGSFVGGQSLIMSSNENSIQLYSETLNEYEDLDSFLTIQTQLNQLSVLSSKKTVVTRTFDFLSSLSPTNGDSLTFSQLTVNLDNYSWEFQAKANAASDDIDYRVLTAFEKSLEYMRYDYGSYVDADDYEIPTYCIIERDDNNTLFSDGDSIYAYWTIHRDGCNDAAEINGDEEATTYDETVYGDENVVKIWRTPQFEAWSNAEYMDLNGNISGVAHFESSCITYTGQESQTGKTVWTSENQCKLINDSQGSNGLVLETSDNARDEGDLVLSFSGNLYFDEGAYDFNNTHLISIGPSGKHNVTDSYVQLQDMFSQEAVECDATDTDCKTANTEE